MESREMNLFDVCRAIVNAIGKSIVWLITCIGDLLRLSYRQWWIVLIFIALCVAAALYYSRPSNRIYKATAIASLNGVSNEMVRNTFKALGEENLAFEHQNKATLLNLPTEMVYDLSYFDAFDIIDLLADSTVDMVDYHHQVPRTDTLCVHMPNMVALQFRTKHPNRLPEIESAILQYLNNQPYFQARFTTYRENLQREALFHRNQIEKLDSLTSIFYFSQNANPQMQLKAWDNGMILGRREIALFLEDIYAEMRVNEYVQSQLATCSAPVVLQSPFTLEARAVNGRLRMSAIAIAIGWILGLAIAAVVENRKRIAAWLQA
jgi:hypothetical protein